MFNAKNKNFIATSTIGVNPPSRSRYSLTESVEEGRILLLGGTDKNTYYNDSYMLIFPKGLEKLYFTWKQVDLMGYSKKF